MQIINIKKMLPTAVSIVPKAIKFDETEYLLRTPANSKRLLKSVRSLICYSNQAANVKSIQQ
ncbi:hypothetical protein HA50_29240 [Pantoea cypripedii]|uniref:Uncharacterized protein n=1 Tax=Pantoea cypripedii TaxID=55209 RepID=A0A1X1EGU0_PANCY|nr:hypothetical protein HA50_29240 [Pantoea cypripedii]